MFSPSIVAGASSLVYANFFYHNYIIGAFHKFPEPVAKQMRKALFYTNQQLEPKNALKYYKEALRVADEIGMDPFSDEIIGVKIQVAELMEKIGQYGKAIEVLEIVKQDNGKWMELLGNKPGNEAKRTRVLLWSIKVSVKLGDLYACPYVLDTEKAEECLVWAVETALREQKRRDEQGVRPEDGEWITDEEQGGALEGNVLFTTTQGSITNGFPALADHYEAKDHWYLAAPLYLKALEFSKPVNCHTTVLSTPVSSLH